MQRYSTYEGKFSCQKCEEMSDQARFWIDTYDLTWQCPNKHVSKVNINGRGY